MIPNGKGETKDGMTTGMKVAMGCAIAAAACFLVIIVAIVLFALNARKIMAFGASQGADTCGASRRMTCLSAM